MIKIGIAGARGLSCMIGFNNIADVEVMALCDINADLLEKEAKTHNIPNTYRVYEDMLESDLDAIVVATPMQNHFQHTILALEAGKHVLSEVTAGVTMDELFWLTEAVEKYNKVYMMAENYNYIPELQMLNNMVDKKVFGDVYFAEGEYIHNIINMTQYANGKNSWRKNWQLGKRGCFYPTHSLGPVMQWFKGDRIKAIQCIGTGWNTHPEYRQEDSSLTLCQMESGRLIKLRLDCLSNRPHNLIYYSLQGTKGAYEAARGMGDVAKIWTTDMNEGDPEKAEWSPLTDFYQEYMPKRYLDATEKQKSAGHWGGDYFIIEDFIHAVQGKIASPVDVYDACTWSAVGLLSELSIMNSGKLIEMPDFKKVKEKKNQIYHI